MYFLLFDDFQDLHGAGLHANTAGDALGGNRRVLCLDHNMEGAGFHALAAANTELLVDHIDTLCVLSNGTSLTGSSALAALNTNHGFCFALQLNDLDAGLTGMELFVKSVGTSTNTFQASHALGALLNSQFFHIYSPLK